METWKPIAGYEGYYEVSNKGRVRSLGRIKRNGRRANPRMLNPKKQHNGYLNVHLFDADGACKSFKIHRLVAAAFLSNPEGKAQVNHKDGNKANNFVENLEWMTASENQEHAHKTLGIPYAPTGLPSPHRKLNREQVEAIRRDLRSQSTIARDYGVCQQTISNIKHGVYYVNW